MQTPNYILKMNEAVIVTKKSDSKYKIIKMVVLIAVGMLLAKSFLSGGNWFERFLLIAVAIRNLFIGRKTEVVPSPVEIQFYDDFLCVYRPKRYYDKKVTRMEYNKMWYSRITKCVLETRSKMLYFYGDVEAKWFNYDENGNVPAAPTYNRIVKDAFCYLSTRCDSQIDYVNEIENHSPIKVNAEDK